MMSPFKYLLAACIAVSVTAQAGEINRRALLERNNPCVTSFDSLTSLSVGNGGFAMTVDATGLQTYPERYSKGIPLGTQSHWGWHNFANPEHYTTKETLKDYNFGRGKKEPYAVQFNETGRNQQAANWYRENPHRLHLGIVGFDFPAIVQPQDFKNLYQELKLRSGMIVSSYELMDNPITVKTVCHPNRDLIAVRVTSSQPLPLKLKFPYPTGAHCDDACNWEANDKHSTLLFSKRENVAILKRVLDETTYYVAVQWEGEATFSKKEANYYVLTPKNGNFAFTCEYLPDFATTFEALTLPVFKETARASATAWADFWNKGGVVDFSACTDPRASELERRVVLSQYLMAIQCAAPTPPQETGLTYNSWFGKFHLEMIWWHQSHFPLWGHADLLDRTLEWYEKAEPMACEIAKRQGFKGARWMKMTDPSALEAPSKVGSFLIWQQPHLIHLAELVYRANPSDEMLHKYYKLIQETADFMCSFATYDKANDRYVLKGIIPAQETLRASETVNPPMELSSWHFGLETAQRWRERMGMKRVAEWDKVLAKLSPLAKNDSGLYLAAETAFSSYTDTRFLTDHPAVLGAVGMYPQSRLVDDACMRKTLNYIWTAWEWQTSWGWDYPMTAMCAARLGEPGKAVDALLMDKQKNTYLSNGHNYQDSRLRLYLPGNGGLLTAVAMMCAGWEGSEGTNPGFPADGTWNVKWEGLMPLP